MWDISVGQQLKRADIHNKYGGIRQGGIAPSRSSPNIMLFTDPSRGHKVGYFDGWGEDGLYHYTGQGQIGDQVMANGNRAILEHVEAGRALRLFEAAAPKKVAYIGEFALAADPAWYSTDAPDAEGEIRSVLMFRLTPATASLSSQGTPLPFTPVTKQVVTDVEIEKQHTEGMVVSPNGKQYEAERREGPLVTAYRDYAVSQGHTVTRNMIRPKGELKPLYTDAFNVTENLLIEAKGTVTREAVRMAIGQLYDYRRFIASEPTLAVLLPTRPREDLIQLCHSADVVVIWQDGTEFVNSKA
ncbi:restriction endonuclease [Streptomyces sp. NPDC057654]|uniref:restriction endonuclease n=1 Tax=Streptomyces sp. NPDC057654 TaxID=3346196 RepID=UPI0036915FB3